MNKSVLMFAVIVVTFFTSCNQKQVEKEIDEYIIKKDSNQTSKENESIYYIKEPTDSTYTGDAEEKYPNGIVKYKGFYRFGKRHGEWLYFYPNGNLWSECVYNRGKMNGKNNVYYPNGRIYYSAFYKNDLKDSIWTYYDTLGNVLYQEIYKNNKLIKRIKR